MSELPYVYDETDKAVSSLWIFFFEQIQKNCRIERIKNIKSTNLTSEKKANCVVKCMQRTNKWIVYELTKSVWGGANFRTTSHCYPALRLARSLSISLSHHISVYGCDCARVHCVLCAFWVTLFIRLLSPVLCRLLLLLLLLLLIDAPVVRP